MLQFPKGSLLHKIRKVIRICKRNPKGADPMLPYTQTAKWFMLVPMWVPRAYIFICVKAASKYSSEGAGGQNCSARPRARQPGKTWAGVSPNEPGFCSPTAVSWSGCTGSGGLCPLRLLGSPEVPPIQCCPRGQEQDPSLRVSQSSCPER